MESHPSTRLLRPLARLIPCLDFYPIYPWPFSFTPEASPRETHPLVFTPFTPGPFHLPLRRPLARRWPCFALCFLLWPRPQRVRRIRNAVRPAVRCPGLCGTCVLSGTKQKMVNIMCGPEFESGTELFDVSPHRPKRLMGASAINGRSQRPRAFGLPQSARGTASGTRYDTTHRMIVASATIVGHCTQS